MIYLTVLTKKSVCVDCIWIDSCQTFKKIDEIRDNRQNPGHPNDILEAVIINCSNKNYDRSYGSEDKGEGSMYYCVECGSMHHGNSRIGRSHKKISITQKINDSR